MLSIAMVTESSLLEGPMSNWQACLSPFGFGLKYTVTLPGCLLLMAGLLLQGCQCHYTKHHGGRCLNPLWAGTEGILMVSF